MFSQMNPQLLQMIMQMHGNGFQNPGSGSPPVSGAPALPDAGPRGASAGMPPMAGTPPGGTPNPNGGGIFGSMAGNPMALMQMLKGMPAGAAAGGAAPGTPGGAPFNAPGMQLPWQSPSAGAPAAPQLPWQQGGAEGQSGIMDLIRKMFGGGAAM